METKEYFTVDKSAWGLGPWQDEPDKRQWLDAAIGLPCLIVRNRMGALCGYAGVPPDHKAYGFDYDGFRSLSAPRIGHRKQESKRCIKARQKLYRWSRARKGAGVAIANIDVHGGLTYDGLCQKREEESHGVCHVDPGKENVWWFGFDCNHSNDFAPELYRNLKEVGGKSCGFMDTDVYRDFSYVTAEVQSLAAQLKKIL